MSAVRTHHHLGFADEKERGNAAAAAHAAEVARAEATVYDARHPAMLAAAIRVLTQSGTHFERVGPLGLRFGYEGRNALASLSRQAMHAERWGGEAAAVAVLEVCGPDTFVARESGGVVVVVWPLEGRREVVWTRVAA